MTSWRDYATCRNGAHPETFFDIYENDNLNFSHRRAVDQMCLSCPVIKQCFGEGVENREYGVWGGVYLKAGKPHKELNNHKTDSIWDLLEERHS